MPPRDRAGLRHATPTPSRQNVPTSPCVADVFAACGLPHSGMDPVPNEEVPCR